MLQLWYTLYVRRVNYTHKLAREINDARNFEFSILYQCAVVHFECMFRVDPQCLNIDPLIVRIHSAIK